MMYKKRRENLVVARARLLLHFFPLLLFFPCLLLLLLLLFCYSHKYKSFCVQFSCSRMPFGCFFLLLLSSFPPSFSLHSMPIFIINLYLSCKDLFNAHCSCFIIIYSFKYHFHLILKKNLHFLAHLALNYLTSFKSFSFVSPLALALSRFVLVQIFFFA